MHLSTLKKKYFKFCARKCTVHELMKNGDGINLNFSRSPSQHPKLQCRKSYNLKKKKKYMILQIGIRRVEMRFSFGYPRRLIYTHSLNHHHQTPYCQFVSVGIVSRSQTFVSTVKYLFVTFLAWIEQCLKITWTVFLFFSPFLVLLSFSS